MSVATIDIEHIQMFILVFVRVTAMLSLLPVLGSQNIPVQLKAGFAFLLSVLVFPLATLDYAGQTTLALPLFVVSIIKETFVGIVIGFATTFLFAAVQFAGLLIDRQMGFALVRLVDPTTQQAVTFSGQFQLVLFTMVFLLMNGHYFLILAIQKSFELIPLLGVQVPAGNLAAFFSGMVANVFVLAIRLAAPVFVVLVLSTLGLAVVARTVPQINIFFVGLPLKIGLGIITTFIALPVITNIFKAMTHNLIEDIWRLLHLMA
ncbi:MAG: flagellar biosynthetic protein FliR [Chitinivibrionales bacterium]|nr:flagellar biosynthetic protein FliR [Chitinivibrionales bacterium]MBD3394030.1 flagellar biosynthetic protein FliR [Chitinivibrionales bacterium]